MFFFFFDENSVENMIDRIKSIKPLKEIIEATKIPQSTISTWKMKKTFPRADDLYKIAQFLNVSMEWLLTGEDKTINLNENEQKILSYFRRLDDHDKRSITLQMEALAGNDDNN